MKTTIYILMLSLVSVNLYSQQLYSPTLAGTVGVANNIKRGSDTSTKNLLNKDTTNSSVKTVIDSISSPSLFFSGTTSVNSTEALINGLQGTQKLDFTAILIPKVNDKCGLDLSVSFNLLNLKPNSINRDSFDLTSLMFPETGNTGFMISPSLHWRLKEANHRSHRWSSDFSFSLRQNKVNNVIANNGSSTNAEDLNFTVLNVNLMPFKYCFVYAPDKDFTFTLNIGVYYNFFNVPNEDAKTFNKLFPADAPMFTSDRGSNIHGAGFKVVAGVNGFMFFTDIRYHISTKGFDDSNPFKGTVFNFGIAQNIKIFEK